jgi:hypothetical protein
LTSTLLRVHTIGRNCMMHMPSDFMTTMVYSLQLDCRLRSYLLLEQDQTLYDYHF